ncbi:Glycosyl transferase family 2 [Propionispira arboris]|uniref:Glycosyl transferase family 2 n=1 Tax=Propionispira arboris TaxID=84035 RepID=A0A1H7CDR7_9FIRM|nr:glycosyltransferase family 2 protein [Propionispira arboris]SEJ87798.1 Glycosyl transferase family 2 [Propionispira arboris]
MEISVIVPIYNAEKYLKQCLDSLLQQTFEDIEIICINDGSTDGTDHILKLYKEKDARIRVYKHVDCGAGASRNWGITLARGKYLAILDADDFFENDFLEKMYVTAENTQADIVICNFTWYDDVLGKDKENLLYVDQSILINQPFSGEDIFDKVYDYQIFCGAAWNKLYRKEFIQQLGIYFLESRKCESCEDMFFTSMASILAKNLIIVKDCLVHYRVNLEGAVSAKRYDKFKESPYYAVLAVYHELLKRDLYDRLINVFSSFVVKHLSYYFGEMRGENRAWFYDCMREQWLKNCGINENHECYLYDNAIVYGKYLETKIFSYDEYKHVNKFKKEKIFDFVMKILMNRGERELVIWGKGEEGIFWRNTLIDGGFVKACKFVDINSSDSSEKIDALLHNQKKYYVLVSPLKYYGSIEKFLVECEYENIMDYIYVHKKIEANTDLYTDLLGNQIVGQGNLEIHFYGANNLIEFEKGFEIENGILEVYGDNNKIKFGTDVKIKTGFRMLIFGEATAVFHSNIVVNNFVTVYMLTNRSFDAFTDIAEQKKIVI